MIVVSPARSDQRITLPADILAGLIDAIGTDDYANACLELFAESLDVEHWALFRDVKPNALTEEELDRVLAPLLLKTSGTE